MASAQSARGALPQGFSVFQPVLGAPLHFFPALGSRQLDHLVAAFIPGPASLADKRATVAVDFFEHAGRTGERFKFYPVAPPAPSPSLGSTASSSSSFSSSSSSSSSAVPSPAASSWDWSAVAASTPSSSSRASRPSPRSRHQTSDFSHLPGMKILTKDGRDITHAASRGSKTRAQRDHAHLMRIIKACDSCRRKKTRCDPSHKKRPAAAAAAAQPHEAAKPSKRPRASLQQAPPPPPPPPPPVPRIQACADAPAVLLDELASFPSTDLDALLGLDSLLGLDDPSPLDLPGLEVLDPGASWDQFVQFPDAADALADFDSFVDPASYFSHSSVSSSTSSASPDRARWSQPRQVSLAPDDVGRFTGAPPGDGDGSWPQPPRLDPFLDLPDPAGSSYTDFCLYSPTSAFSEDHRMLSVGSLSSPSPDKASSPQPQQSRAPLDDAGRFAGAPPGGDGFLPPLGPTIPTGIDYIDFALFSPPAPAFSEHEPSLSVGSSSASLRSADEPPLPERQPDVSAGRVGGGTDSAEAVFATSTSRFRGGGGDQVGSRRRDPATTANRRGRPGPRAETTADGPEAQTPEPCASPGHTHAGVEGQGSAIQELLVSDALPRRHAAGHARRQRTAKATTPGPLPSPAFDGAQLREAAGPLSDPDGTARAPVAQPLCSLHSSPDEVSPRQSRPLRSPSLQPPSLHLASLHSTPFDSSPWNRRSPTASDAGAQSPPQTPMMAVAAAAVAAFVQYVCAAATARPAPTRRRSRPAHDEAVQSGRRLAEAGVAVAVAG